MGYFYIDESIHSDAGFIIATCVYMTADVTEDVNKIFVQFDQNPNEFEYKSSTNYSKNESLKELRSALKDLLYQKCKIGLVILPNDAREFIASECLKAINQFVHFNNIVLPVDVYLDQGMVKLNGNTIKLTNDFAKKSMIIHFEQDSKQIKGIQLADLASHLASIQLKCRMGLINKMVKVKGDSIYDEVELAFEMFATLRYVFFRQNSKTYDPEQDLIQAATLNVEPYGLFISEYCNSELQQIAKSQFSKIYLGCIH